MLGAIAGDVIGSIYEAMPIKTKQFPLFDRGATFTDDTVCTVAIADAIMRDADLAGTLRAFCRRHPGRGYGGMFARWIMTDGMGPYGSWGNGAAMRVGGIAHLAKDEAEALDLAGRSAAVSHDHPDAIAGAQAAVLAAWRGRQGRRPDEIRTEIADRFGYDLERSVDEIRPRYAFDISCKGTVPPAITCALEATDYEDAVRNAISLGGDADTLACITGGIAEMRFGVPDDVAAETRARLAPDLLDVVDRLYARAAGSGG